jgi:hypothetical protein
MPYVTSSDGTEIFLKGWSTIPLIMALQIAGLSVALLEIDTASVEPLLIEGACGTGCALVPESVIARLRIPGVSFRRLGGTTPVGCKIGAVLRKAEWDPSLSALIGGLAGPHRERSMIAA